MRVFSLTRWSWQIQTEFLVFRSTWENDPARFLFFRYGAITLYGWTFPDSILLNKNFLTRRGSCQTFRPLPATPILLRWQSWHNIGLGSSQFARRYYGNLGWFTFLELIRCFSSLAYLQLPMCSAKDNLYTDWVSPFGNPRIKDCFHLPEAYRR